MLRLAAVAVHGALSHPDLQEKLPAGHALTGLGNTGRDDMQSAAVMQVGFPSRLGHMTLPRARQFFTSVLALSRSASLGVIVPETQSNGAMQLLPPTVKVGQ